MAWRQAVQLTQFLYYCTAPQCGGGGAATAVLFAAVCGGRGVEPPPSGCYAGGGGLLASLPVAAPPTCATPCGDSQTKEMCKSDLTLVGECVAEFLSDYRLVCQLARLQPNGFDRILEILMNQQSGTS
jgi:hypothetical protein